MLAEVSVSRCGLGSNGVLCANCEADHFKFGSFCYKCPELSFLPFSFALVAVPCLAAFSLLVLYPLLFWAQYQLPTFSMFLLFLQAPQCMLVISLTALSQNVQTTGSFTLSWPQTTTSAVAFLDVFLFSPGHIVNDCEFCSPDMPWLAEPLLFDCMELTYAMKWCHPYL